MTQALRPLSWVAALFFGVTLAVPTPLAALDYSETCRYFANQAFKDRRAGRGTTFRMDLAQDCVDALIYLHSDDAATRDRAAAYLAELDIYRGEIVAILVRRARARATVPTGFHRTVGPAVPPVSWAGSYLIARRMGIVDTHHEWTTWRQTVAAADPRFRID